MTDDDAGSAENGEDAHSRLAVARLNVLARQGRVDEFLQRARAERQFLSLATMLLKLERVDEAVAVGRQHLTSAEETFTLAQLLRARGHPELALDIAEMGLGREGYLSSLAVWTRDLASGLGLTDRALPAALIAYRATPELPTYLAVAELAGPAWPGMRDDLLASARAAQTYNTAGIVDVLLHENLVADAIDVVDKRYAYYDVVRQVADAATATHPDWVIRTCTRQAEEIMNRGKADAYHHAADWLAKTKRAYHAAGREAEWQNYLAELLTLHHRKSKLRPLLEALRR
jgi:uncharacterized Zn finger protein